MKLRNTLLALLCAASITASAIPARRGMVHQFQQPDGTTVSLELVGDEHNHYYLTTDKKIVVADGNKFCYAAIDAADNLIVTDILAHNPESRSADESMVISKIDPEQVRLKILSPQKAQSRANNQDGNGKIRANFPTKGNVKSLVFLVSFKDLDFTIENPNEYFSNMLNQPGFSENGAIGSCLDYYIDASMGQFTPEFDVYGPVKLPKEMAYYGRNNAFQTDVNIRHMLMHAGQILDPDVDFRQYDLDGDGYVDNVFIFYAGFSEADGADPNCVWPQSTDVGFNFNYIFDNVQLNHFACASELDYYTKKPDGIGTFCHEFAHVLGLPDLYNTITMNEIYTPCIYDLMDSGSNLSNGNVPCTLSAYERNALGWMGDNLIEITGPATCTLEPLQTSGKAYLVNTDRKNEFFLFENRQQFGWDAKLPGHGMLIWHIDYDFDAFTYNETNNYPDHQRVDIIEANGVVDGHNNLAMSRYPFPGRSKITSFTYDGNPSFRAWSGLDLGLPITDIKEVYVDGMNVITFNVAGGGDAPGGINDVASDCELSCKAIGRQITATANGEITVTDISGRVIATGHKSLTADVQAPGLYIVASASGSTKLHIR